MQLPPVLPLFDRHSLDEGNAVVNQHIANLSLTAIEDAGLIYQLASQWLSDVAGNDNNFKTYRSELTPFLHWCFDVAKQSPLQLDRRGFARHVAYCQCPPAPLIGFRNVAQFVYNAPWQCRIPNSQWLPFLGKKHRPYQLSPRALATKVAVLSSFYAFLIDEDVTERNPASQWLRFQQRQGAVANLNWDSEEDLKAFSELQWSYVMATAKAWADQAPERHERTLFLVSLLYSCYLRISEVAARPGFSPVMGQFRRDSKTGVWSFRVPVSKGGKSRRVALSKALLTALGRYRQFLGLAPLPAPGDNTPLFVRHKAAGRGREQGLLNANLGIRQLRDDIDKLITEASIAAMADGFDQDAREMRELSAHSIRHTGISHDINLNQRPLAHVQADAGHDSIHTTSLYLHTAIEERHQSAENKPLNHLE
ncbi:tyrosine-type recombinase/integrase [Gallaecimonas mangrovi]|uniref:tyrosine-type recombinase/integrase n=1 Tax=Gallaecimonas mangrovi TaxID=2291597 RepID=UPI000E206E92|nr:site-specific integrase [Gallaecimonas mangrovi]